MKRLSMAFAAALFLMACGDNSGTETETGGSIDSAATAPMTSPSDNTMDMQSDSTHTMDSMQNNSSGSQGSAPTPSGAGGAGSTE